ncbi:MAG: protein kinase [Acidobacteriaceae bacterium]|nr:protein kinase [Acidobacteriaceae bacterium]
MIGATIDGYLIQEKLGEGGMGTVYRALEVNLERLVAIKVLNADLAHDASIAERFRAEARAQANLNHANIATLYNFLISQNSAMMVMEYVDGESFQQMVDRRGPIPAQEIIPLFRQALLGLGAAHRQGIVHRDIKPSNIMLNKAGIVKVMDFGIAKALGANRGLTRTGIQVGTVFYMSPEQVKGERVDIRSDIYALGVTLYEMLTAHVPFSANSDFQVLTDHVNTAPPLPTRFYPYIPKGIENIVLKALEKHPDDRFQTVEEFGAALEHPQAWEGYVPKLSAVAPPVPPPGSDRTRLGSSVSIPLPVSAPPPAAVTPVPSAPIEAPAPTAPARSRRPSIAPKWIAAAALALLLVISALAYIAMRPKPAPPASKTTIAQSAAIPSPATPEPVGATPASTATLAPPPPDLNPPATGQPAASAQATSSTPAPRRRRSTDTTATAPPPTQTTATVAPPPAPVAAPAPAPTPAAAEIVIPAATQVTVRLIGPINGDTAQPGQVFPASIDSPIVVQGKPVVPRLANAQVRLVGASKAGRFAGSAKLDLQLASFTIDGRRYPVQSAVYEAESGARGKRTGKFAGIGGALGAVVGGIEHGGKGALAGAAAGGAAGSGAAGLTGDRALELPAESRLSFTLQAPITVLSAAQ